MNKMRSWALIATITMICIQTTWGQQANTTSSASASDTLPAIAAKFALPTGIGDPVEENYAIRVLGQRKTTRN